MESILNDLPGVAILITGKNDEEHLNNLDNVLNRLNKKGLKLRKDKIKFMFHEVEYNGFIISKDWVKPTTSKIEAIHGADAPENINELRSFIGLANYLRNFVKKFAEIMAPLYKLLTKGTKWRWTKKENDAFNAIKDAITTRRGVDTLQSK